MHVSAVLLACAIGAPAGRASALRAYPVSSRFTYPHTLHRPGCKPSDRTLVSRTPKLPKRASNIRCAASAAAAAEERRVNLRYILGYLWPRGRETRARLRVVASLVLLVAAKLFVVQVPFIFKHAIDALSAQPVQNAVGWMFAYGVSRSLYTLLQEGRYLLFTPVGQNALRRFMCDSFAHVQSLDVQWLSSQSTGELSRVFARGMRGMNALLRLVLFNVLPTALEASLAIAILGRRYGGIFLLTAAMTVASFVGWTFLVVQRRVLLLASLNDNDNALFTKFFNSLLNNEAVRVNVNERYEVARYDELLSTQEHLAVSDVQTVSLLNAGQALTYWTGLGVMMGLCASGVYAGRLSVGDAVAINGMLLQLHAPLTALGFTYQEIRQAMTDMRQLLQLLRKSRRVFSLPDAPPLQATRGSISFEGVSFGYTSNGGNLRNVSFQIRPGRKTAIVGSSGSGKSTVLKMILRLHDPDEGVVRIDGQDVRSVQLDSLRKQIALVPQDTILFDDSVLHNIRYGNLSLPEEVAMEVAERVGLTQTVAAMKDGFATRVGERGMRLSGGERQRVAIARALLAQPAIVLCDEPTSALDSLTETSIEQVLDESFRNLTTIVVAHKLRSIVDADQIIVMKDGRLVERGSHLSLLCKANSTYSRMWAKQTQGDEDALSELPDYCELLDSAGLSQMSLGEVEDALALRSVEGRWLW